jgi:hypothetical protein
MVRKLYPTNLKSWHRGRCLCHKNNQTIPTHSFTKNTLWNLQTWVTHLNFIHNILCLTILPCVCVCMYVRTMYCTYCTYMYIFYVFYVLYVCVVCVHVCMYVRIMYCTYCMCEYAWVYECIYLFIQYRSRRWVTISLPCPFFLYLSILPLSLSLAFDLSLLLHVLVLL